MFFASAAPWQLASASCSAQRAVTMPCPTQRVLTLPARLLYQICRRQPCGALCPCRAPGAPWRSIGLRGAREAHGALWGPMAMGPHRASSMGPHRASFIGLHRLRWAPKGPTRLRSPMEPYEALGARPIKPNGAIGLTWAHGDP